LWKEGGIVLRRNIKKSKERRMLKDINGGIWLPWSKLD
jgi:hypothetical protein